MATAKTATLTFRIEPNLKEAVRTAADRDHRSIANMIESPRDSWRLLGLSPASTVAV